MPFLSEARRRARASWKRHKKPGYCKPECGEKQCIMTRGPVIINMMECEEDEEDEEVYMNVVTCEGEEED